MTLDKYRIKESEAVICRLCDSPATCRTGLCDFCLMLYNCHYFTTPYVCPCGRHLPWVGQPDFEANRQHTRHCPEFQEQRAIWLLEKGAEL